MPKNNFHRIHMIADPNTAKCIKELKNDGYAKTTSDVIMQAVRQAARDRRDAVSSSENEEQTGGLGVHNRRQTPQTRF